MITYRTVLLLLPATGKHHHALFLVLPVDQSELFQLATVVTNCDDVWFNLFRKGIVGHTLRMSKDVLKQTEYLFVVVLVKIEAELLQTFLSLLLLMWLLTSKPGVAIFFKRLLYRPH